VSPLLLHVFATFAPAGPQIRTAQLINATGSAFRHAVLAMDGVTTARDLIDPGIDFKVLPSLPRAGSLRTSLRLHTLLKERKPHLLLSYNWGSIDALLALCMGSKIPALHHEDGFLPDEVAGLKKRRTIARRALLKRVNGLVVPSERLAKIACEAWRQPTDQVHLIPNGIHEDRYEGERGSHGLRHRFNIPDNAVVIGFCGHLRAEKNPVRLLEAVDLMKEQAHVLIVGDGPETRRVRETARDLGLQNRVHLAGHIKDPVPYYRAMDVFALSSDTEQMPVALLEAMASSLPTVCTDVGDVRRMLPDCQDNFVLPISGRATPIAFAAALDTVCAGQSTRERLGNANRERVLERYSFASMRQAHEALWQRFTR
jgi:glycosyltransferase involved in cell wall biosynthesis